MPLSGYCLIYVAFLTDLLHTYILRNIGYEEVTQRWWDLVGDNLGGSYGWIS